MWQGIPGADWAEAFAFKYHLVYSALQGQEMMRVPAHETAIPEPSLIQNALNFFDQSLDAAIAGDTKTIKSLLEKIETMDSVVTADLGNALMGIIGDIMTNDPGGEREDDPVAYDNMVTTYEGAWDEAPADITDSIASVFAMEQLVTWMKDHLETPIPVADLRMIKQRITGIKEGRDPA